MTVFRSQHAFLRVDFPPERFGMGTSVEPFFDEHGNERMRRKRFPPVKFNMGMALVKDASSVERMRKHPGMGGQFWEEKEADTNAISAIFSQSASLPEGGLSDADKAQLATMQAAALKVLAVANVKKVLADIEWAIVRFRVSGFTPPDESKRPPVIRAALVLLLDLLDEQGIMPDDDAESTDTGNGAGAGEGPGLS